MTDGGFVFLPCGVEHGYHIQSKGDIHLLVITAPTGERASGGWGGFVADFESQGELRSSPATSS